jgi:hypothetical protein
MQRITQLISRVYGAAPDDLTGADASWRTFPWIVPLFAGSVAVAWIWPDSVIGGVLIGLWWIAVWACWWSRVGRHWHPLRSVRRWRS